MSDFEDIRDAVGLKIRPISHWPGNRNYDHDRSPFKAKFRDTVTLIKRELWHIGARNVVLQIDLLERDIRLDGLPRMDARPTSSGIILSFECEHGALSLPCDTFGNWQHNLRAIGMHLENLRHASLYGVGRRGEQYKGWRAIEAPRTEANGFASVEDAARWLHAAALPDSRSITPVAIMDVAECFAQIYRSAVKLLHPDTGGTHEQFTKLQEAKRMLDEHHRRAA